MDEELFGKENKGRIQMKMNVMLLDFADYKQQAEN